jgi:DNA invertase Pin-like site-specific DNA recombinase
VLIAAPTLRSRDGASSKGTRLTVHILAAVAEHEREMISERTKAALAAAKRRGQRLGNPNNLTEVAKRGTATGKANARRFAANVHPIIEEIMSGELAKLRQRVDDNQPTTLREPLERLLGLRTVRAFAANVQFATCG